MSDETSWSASEHYVDVCHELALMERDPDDEWSGPERAHPKSQATVLPGQEESEMVPAYASTGGWSGLRAENEWFWDLEECR
jgi:hypothetical protein